MFRDAGRRRATTNLRLRATGHADSPTGRAGNLEPDARLRRLGGRLRPDRVWQLVQNRRAIPIRCWPASGRTWRSTKIPPPGRWRRSSAKSGRPATISTRPTRRSPAAEPTREVCHVVAPAGESGDWPMSGPVAVRRRDRRGESHRADDFACARRRRAKVSSF